MEDNIQMEDNLIILERAHNDRKIVVLTLKGEVNSVTAPQFEKKLLSALDDKGTRILLDLKDAPYVSSAGWGVMVGRIKEVREKKGDILISGMRIEVEEIFNLLDFQRLFKVFPDAVTALKSL